MSRVVFGEEGTSFSGVVSIYLGTTRWHLLTFSSHSQLLVSFLPCILTIALPCANLIHLQTARSSCKWYSPIPSKMSVFSWHFGGTLTSRLHLWQAFMVPTVWFCPTYPNLSPSLKCPPSNRACLPNHSASCPLLLLPVHPHLHLDLISCTKPPPHDFADHFFLHPIMIRN